MPELRAAERSVRDTALGGWACAARRGPAEHGHTQAKDPQAGEGAPSFRELRPSPEGPVPALPLGGFARPFPSRGLRVPVPQTGRRL